MRISSTKITHLLVGTVVALAPAIAFAALGDNVASIQADQARMKGAIRIHTSQTYTVQEISAPSGTVVREFVAPSGDVFAIAWQGPFMPDLHQLLGSYFDQYSQAAQGRARRARRVPLSIQEPGLVVQTGGHMRAFTGRAYLPDKLPDGVTAEAIH